MNTAIQTVIDHIKAKADLNGDGKVDKQDFDLVSKMVKADAEYVGATAMDFARGQSTQLVASHAPQHVVGGAFLAGIVLTLAVVKFFAI